MTTRFMMLVLAVVMASGSVRPALAAENLKLNQKLDYTSDSHDGPLITGDRLDEGVVPGKPTYAIIYGEACFNSKRQARRTVELYEKYKDRVQFVVVDLDRHRSREQKDLVKKFYTGSIPHVVVLNRDASVAYNAAGEVDSEKIAKLLEQALAR
jgi:hypothetical protein